MIDRAHAAVAQRALDQILAADQLRSVERMLQDCTVARADGLRALVTSLALRTYHNRDAGLLRAGPETGPAVETVSWSSALRSSSNAPPQSRVAGAGLIQICVAPGTAKSDGCFENLLQLGVEFRSIRPALPFRF